MVSQPTAAPSAGYMTVEPLPEAWRKPEEQPPPREIGVQEEMRRLRPPLAAAKPPAPEPVEPYAGAAAAPRLKPSYAYYPTVYPTRLESGGPYAGAPRGYFYGAPTAPKREQRQAFSCCHNRGAYVAGAEPAEAQSLIGDRCCVCGWLCRCPAGGGGAAR